jgi:hypothetical protein
MSMQPLPLGEPVERAVWAAMARQSLHFYTRYTFARRKNFKIGVSWGGGFYMLAGAFVFVGGALFAWIKGWPRAIPWLFPGTFWFFTPALNDKARGAPLLGGAAFRTRSGDFHPWGDPTAWYGNGWWQIAMFLVLLALSYGVWKLLDDGY